MWNVPAGSPVVTIYFQGLLNSQVSAALYCERLLATTGEIVTFPNSLPLLYQPWVGKELAEVELADSSGWLGWWNRFDHWRVGYRFAAESKLHTHSVRLHKSNFGQIDDIIEHSHKVSSAPDADLILFGYSRGAVATFCALAHFQYPRVRLVILEAIVDSMPENLRRMSFLHSLGLKSLMAWFTPAYDSAGISALDLVDRFPNVPVGMIAIEGDTVAHIASQHNLAMRLAERGIPVYLLVLRTTGHAPAPLQADVHRQQVLVFLHALYEQYNLPHISALAEEGKLLLSNSRL